VTPEVQEFGSRVLLLLIIGIALLVLLAIGFAISVVMLRRKNDRTRVHWQRLESKWDEVLLDVLAGARPKDAFWEIVAPGEQLYAVNYVLRYIKRVEGEERVRLQELGRPYLEPVIPRMQRGDPERRARAVQTVGEIGLPEHAELVIRALDDPSPLVAMVAARSLARKEHPEFIREVLKRLHRFSTWSRNFLSSMLAAVGADAMPILREVYGDPHHPTQVRAIVAQALGYLHDFGAADVAARVLETEEDREILAASLRLISGVGQPEHLPAVRRLVTSSDFVVRAAAVSAIGNIGRPDDMPLLHTACEDDSRWVAIHAARALRDAGHVDSLQKLAASGRARATLAMQVLSEVDL
jgi:HEAT repeat protein